MSNPIHSHSMDSCINYLKQQSDLFCFWWNQRRRVIPTNEIWSSVNRRNESGISLFNTYKFLYDFSNYPYLCFFFKLFLRKSKKKRNTNYWDLIKCEIRTCELVKSLFSLYKFLYDFLDYTFFFQRMGNANYRDLVKYDSRNSELGNNLSNI